MLFDADRKALDATAKRVTKAINELGFNARVEDTNTLDAFFGSLPGHCDENVRRPLMNTLNLGDLMPTSSIWSGEGSAPCPFYPALSPALMSCLSSGSAPFWLNLHVRDIGHTIMFGPTTGTNWRFARCNTWNAKATARGRPSGSKRSST